MAVFGEQKILQLFFCWSSKTGANLEDQVELECLYDLERFVGAHLNKQIEAKIKKKKDKEKRLEKSALKRVEMTANHLMIEAANTPPCDDDGRWTVLNQKQKDQIACEKEIVDRIYKLQLKQDYLRKTNEFK
jgi:tartrate dehydratase alpha subunit/fumarate hydratase class I-like protein